MVSLDDWARYCSESEIDREEEPDFTFLFDDFGQEEFKQYFSFFKLGERLQARWDKFIYLQDQWHLQSPEDRFSQDLDKIGALIDSDVSGLRQILSAEQKNFFDHYLGDVEIIFTEKKSRDFENLNPIDQKINNWWVEIEQYGFVGNSIPFHPGFGDAFRSFFYWTDSAKLACSILCPLLRNGAAYEPYLKLYWSGWSYKFFNGNIEAFKST